jgi:hypothetical protein
MYNIGLNLLLFISNNALYISNNILKLKKIIHFNTYIILILT